MTDMPTAEQTRNRMRHQDIREGTGAKHHQCYCPHCVESREHPMLHRLRQNLRDTERGLRTLRELKAEGVGVEREIAQRTWERRELLHDIDRHEAELEGR